MKNLLTTLIIILGVGNMSCNQTSNKTDFATINIELNSNSDIVFEGRTISSDQLSQFLANRVDEITQSGFPRDEIVVSLNVSQQAATSKVITVQKELREQQLRKLNYSI